MRSFERRVPMVSDVMWSSEGIGAVVGGLDRRLLCSLPIAWGMLALTE
jgi:hypothetical protein